MILSILGTKLAGLLSRTAALSHSMNTANLIFKPQKYGQNKDKNSSISLA